MKKFSYLLLLVTLLVACSKVPITGRKQMKLLPNSVLSNMATTSYKDFLSKSKMVPVSDGRSKMVKDVGVKITGAVNAFLVKEKQMSRVEGFKWEYNLVDDATVNAWAMPGGKIVFYSGILDYTEDAEGLAVVMGHEIGHVIAKHGNERMSQQLLLTMGGLALSEALSEKPEETTNLFLLAYGAGSQLGSLAYSRQHEYEADKLGMVFMAMAGYNPSRSIAFWERMSAGNSAKPPAFLSTHPSDNNRIAELKAYLPEAMKYYKGK